MIILAECYSLKHKYLGALSSIAACRCWISINVCLIQIFIYFHSCHFDQGIPLYFGNDKDHHQAQLYLLCDTVTANELHVSAKTRHHVFVHIQYSFLSFYAQSDDEPMGRNP